MSGRVARNVDTWMLSAEANRAVLAEAAAGADAVVVEGMMGLFDGKEAATERGSSAEIAKLLDCRWCSSSTQARARAAWRRWCWGLSSSTRNCGSPA